MRKKIHFRLACIVVVGIAVLGVGCGDEEGSSAGKSGGSQDASVDVEQPPDARADGADVGADVDDGGVTQCVPKTCAQLGANCGSAPDGCGGVITCGTCPDGQNCGGAGANKCGVDTCTPKSCVQAGAQCGWASDGCSEAIDCGGCAAPATCGGTGDFNACGCTPKTCAQLGVNCGTLPDGCVGTIECGSCSGGQSCGGGGQNVCGTTACNPKTCAQLGAACGFASDGCSQALDCGNCTDPAVCGGGGVVNQCGCTAKSCAQLGASCGTVNTGCGDVACGTCTAPDTCGGGGTDNQCGCTCSLDHAQTRCLAGVCSIDQCDVGWGNCDGDTDNGCEKDTATDPASCGTCSHGCSFANASASCEGGQCVLGACSAGFADCDGDPGNGCEANLATDPSNCNVCGNSCPSLGGTAVCVSGVCDVSNCGPGLGDCEPGTPGCETDITTSASHCGACGNACSFSNASAKCVASTCHIDTCNGGYGNCDANESNGCEVDFSLDPDHCGSCSIVCNATNGTAFCSSATCGISCNFGWGNCDTNASNGCELNTQISATNCGACGQACSNNHVPSPACSGGVCSGTCQNGYSDCNSNKLTDGCETNTNSDSNNCGGCGNVCPGGQPCVSGACYDPCSTNTCNAHGWCNTSGACECDPGYTGSSCTSCTGGWTGSSGSCYPTNQITGTGANDSITGTSGNDYIRGLDGSDTLRGMEGMDFLSGNAGDDPLVNGNVGNDEVRGGDGNDSVYGGSDNDAVFGDLGNDHVYGDAGNDRLTGGEGNDTLEGGDGNDRYMIDGLGDDIINDASGYDEARCLPGIKIGTNVMVGSDRRLTLTNGRTVLILGDRVETILGCN